MNLDLNLNELGELALEGSTRRIRSLASTDTFQNGDKLPKSFLQLKGISVAKFKMGCNFHILPALQIKIKYSITILAIQQHTAWNREFWTARSNPLNASLKNGDTL